MTADHEFILFFDESDRKGPFYSNFYGCVAVGSSQYGPVTRRLAATAARLSLGREVKWERISAPYADKYIELMRAFFAEVAMGHIRVRVMFRPTGLDPVGLSREQAENEFFLLYYQFIKHGLGLAHAPPTVMKKRLRLYFDQFPDTSERATQFRGFLLGLQRHPGVHAAGFVLAESDVAEVRSHEHILLQCLDVVLGAMTFRLNNKHRAKPPGARRRGKRTVSKERVYKALLAEIRRIRPGFNIGISTGVQPSDRWETPYLHWSFHPKGADPVRRRTKGKAKSK